MIESMKTIVLSVTHHIQDLIEIRLICLSVWQNAISTWHRYVGMQFDQPSLS
jgi:hypothetical protein